MDEPDSRSFDVQPRNYFFCFCSTLLISGGWDGNINNMMNGNNAGE